MDRLPIAIQTIYAELIDRAWTGDLVELTAAGGSASRREVKGRGYWYWQPPQSNGHREPARYVGPDSPEVRARLAAMTELKGVKSDRRDLVRSLLRARLQGPDALSGRSMEALAKAGAFRLRAVVIGSAAFQCYPGLLGVRFPGAMSRTGDLDIGQFRTVALAVEDRIDKPFLDVLREVDPRFEAIPHPMDGRRTLRYAVRAGTQQLFAVDILSPLRGPDEPSPTYLDALRSDAQVIRYLDFLLYEEINAVSLHGVGIPINVPAPERFAVHKLAVSQLRVRSAESQAKSRKDIAQAGALIEVLLADRPDELRSVWHEFSARGPNWAECARRGAALLPAEARSGLANLVESPPQ